MSPVIRHGPVEVPGLLYPNSRMNQVIGEGIPGVGRSHEPDQGADEKLAGGDEGDDAPISPIEADEFSAKRIHVLNDPIPGNKRHRRPDREKESYQEPGHEASESGIQTRHSQAMKKHDREPCPRHDGRDSAMKRSSPWTGEQGREMQRRNGLEEKD